MRWGFAGVVVCLLALAACGGGGDDDGSGMPCEGETACNGCSTDAECVADPDVGPDHICVDGECVTGNCREDSDCTGGQVCDDDTRLCRACVDVSEDDRCGADAACIEGACTAMACNTSEQCSEPDLCIDHRCGCAEDATCDGGLCVDGACAPCSDAAGDAECVAAYGAGRLCVEGHCISGDCRTDGECGGGSICCSNNCAGNDCCGVGDDAHCDALVPGFVCNASGQCVCPDRAAGSVAVSDGGDDSNGNGSSTCPVRSITRALQLAATDPSTEVSISVGAATYRNVDGESFPLVIDRTGLVITGAGADSTVLLDASGGAAMRIEQPVTIIGMHLVSVGSATRVLDVRASGQVTSSIITGSAGVTAACVDGSAGATGFQIGPSVLVESCVSGVLAGSGAQLTISASITENQEGVVVNTGGAIDVAGGTISFNGGDGVRLADGAVSNITSQIAGATIQGNGGDGVEITLNSRVRIRDSIVTGNSGSGVRASGASVLVDFGSLAEAGGNTFNTSGEPNGGVGLCNLTGRTLDAVSDVWSTCPPSVDAGCSGGADINANVNAANCSSQ